MKFFLFVCAALSTIMLLRLLDLVSCGLYKPHWTFYLNLFNVAVLWAAFLRGGW